MSRVLPNILLIMMDATRPDRLSCYGYQRPTTPNIDRIAAEGVLYEQAFSPEVWTLPVMSSVFTGLTPREHGVTFQHHRLASHHVTLAGLLAKQGYVTWGTSSNAWISRATGLDRGFSEFWEPYRLLKGAALPKLGRETKLGALTYLINGFYAKYVFGRTDKGARRINPSAIRWLRSGRSHQEGSPFFMFVHYLEPHAPYRPPRPFDALYLPDRQLREKARRIRHQPLDFFAGKIVLDDEDLELLNRLYDAEISYMDSQLGQLYGTLAESDLLENTALLLFADHGENIGDHGLLDHHFCLYDSLIHVPLIIRYPREFPKGHRIEELVQIPDIFRTVLELAGSDGERIPGYSRSLRVEDVRANPRDHVLAETSEANLSRIQEKGPVHDLSRYDRKLWAVRTSRYKYIEGSDGSVEFYDLQTDPDELCNRAGERSGALATLAQNLQESQMQAQSQTEDRRPDATIDDPVVAERLRSLGYID